MTNDDTSRIVDQWAGESSSTIEQRSEEATGDGRDDAGALLAPVFGIKRMSGGHSPQKLPSASEGHAIVNPIPVLAKTESGGHLPQKLPSASEGYALADY